MSWPRGGGAATLAMPSAGAARWTLIGFVLSAVSAVRDAAAGSDVATGIIWGRIDGATVGTVGGAD
ncbi:hypothetical protein HMP06_1723 [Sphingomonas sp. HMP6]|nr:hypothetical protein HMP06_1723 [Sphingomonas sp. HMP6]